jgi:hypothetical protein
MLREAKLTRGIGARIAHNTPRISTKDALVDLMLTSVTNAKQKKTTKIAQHKDLTSRNRIKDQVFLRSHLVGVSVVIPLAMS